jgi:hypothetical protein
MDFRTGSENNLSEAQSIPQRQPLLRCWRCWSAAQTQTHTFLRSKNG